MLHLNIESLTILSSLYVKDYKNVEGTQLINLSSRGGYMLVKNAVTYCASKFYVSAFTEGLALELAANHCPLKAKVLAPAATKNLDRLLLIQIVMIMTSILPPIILVKKWLIF